MFKSGVLAIGADPEVFLFTKDGKPHSVEGLLGGTKHEPKPMYRMPEGFFVQEDNVAAEFNIPPASSAVDFNKNIARALKYIHREIDPKKFDLRCVAAAHFTKAQLSTVQAQTLGCEPDFNAWARQENLPPRPPETLRTAAGHVHVSWDNPVQPEQELLIRYLDLVLGVPSILATEKTERRTLYGRAGCFRPKNYGVEYRTLDNFWVDNHEDRIHIYNTVVRAVQTLQRNHKLWAENLEEFAEEIQDTINNHDSDKALNLMHMYDLAPFTHV